MKNPLKAILFLALSLGGFWLLASAQKPQPPNIVMIAVDDLNDFIGGMGHPDAITPNLDKLIKRGTLFTNAHCQSPMCSPSRAAIMTGLRPSTTGIYGMISDNKVKETNAATRQTTFLHQYFKDAGYYTMGIGKIFHDHAPDGLFNESGDRAKGFGPYPPKHMKWDNDGTSTDWGPFPEKDEQMPDYQSARWAVERLGRSYEKPFFLTVGFLRPHVPWHVPQKWFDLYDPKKLHEPPYLKTDRDDLPPIARRVDDWPMMPTTDWAIESGEWKNILQGYLASVSFVDHYIGEILDALEGSPYAKMCLWDQATSAPLIFAGPGIPQNTKIDAPVELFSVYPTLTDLCGLSPNKNLESHSLYPLLKSPKMDWLHPAITTWGRNNHAIKTKDYRYIRYEDGFEELYAVKSDPNEWYNVATDKKYAKVKADLKKYLPAVNVKWAAASQYDTNEYFIKQKREQSEAAPDK